MKVGAVLLQNGADGSAYCLTSLPTLNAIRVIVYTDHKPLVFTNHMYNHNQRLMRWALLAQDYNPDFRHKKDIDNIMALCPK